MSDDEDSTLDEPCPLEERVKELLDEAQAIGDLEKRIEELEKHLQGEKERNSAAISQLCDQETMVKELLIQSKEECIKQRETVKQLSTLQQQSQMYKKRVEAAREVAAEHFLKYKQVQEQLETLKKAGFAPTDDDDEGNAGGAASAGQGSSN